VLRTRRDKMQIIEDILRASEGPRGALKTHLVYGANLNFARLDKHLYFLLNKGFMELRSESEDRYFLTGKGREFLKMAQNTREFLNRVSG